jgi:hypothetical protein
MDTPRVSNWQLATHGWVTRTTADEIDRLRQVIVWERRLIVARGYVDDALEALRRLRA